MIAQTNLFSDDDRVAKPRKAALSGKASGGQVDRIRRLFALNLFPSIPYPSGKYSLEQLSAAEARDIIAIFEDRILVRGR